MYVLHERLRPDQVEARDYQLALAAAAADEPLLLVLPTGLGKTAIALLTMLRRIDKDPKTRTLVLAPTKPLVEQHARFLRETLVEELSVESLTGETSPDDRRTVWTRADIVCATPQVVRNDLMRQTLAADAFDFLVFDEAHRAVGNYAYVFLAQRMRGHRLGLSASPGTDLPTIRRVLKNLALVRTEVRTETDADVKPYVHEVQTEWVRVKPDATLVQLARLLQRSLSQTVAGLRRLGFLDRSTGSPSRKHLIELGARLRAQATRRHASSNVYQALSLQARALKIEHAVELCETQGPGPVARFLERVAREADRAGGSKAARDWAASESFAQALEVARNADAPHPKVSRLVDIVTGQLGDGARRVLVFANYRETADELVRRLSEHPDVRADRFVGHGRGRQGPGLTKKQQQQVVDGFRDGATNVLVATSVGEEGLDLPECDAVVLFEPVASGIRMIQRRGRTGRRRDGKFFVLMTEGTRDAAYYWAARRRERRMNSELRSLRRQAPAGPAVSASRPSKVDPEAQEEAASNVPEVVVDTREFQSPLARRLLEDGVRVKAERLDVGDYRIGETLVVERKTVDDLAASIVDGRFFDQVPRLGAVGRGLLLVEGDLDGQTRLSRNALAGAAASAYVEHGVGLVVVPDAHTASDFVAALARRRRRMGEEPKVPARPSPKRADEAAVARHLFEGLPGVGPVLADRLRERFGSMARLVAVSAEELAAVDGVGTNRARAIQAALRGEPGSPSRVEADVAEDLALKAGDGAAG